MADQEFERIVQEGMDALKKSRERLKLAWDKPRDWEEITPEPLKPAVMHIRREFETAAWQLSEQVECVCYLCLHPELTTSPTYKGRPNLIQADLRETWHLQFEGMTESERFAHWTKQYGELLKKNVAVPLNAFLKIGLAQESQLPLPAVEWAKTLTRGLLFSLRWTVPHLIKKMCDEQENKLDLDISTFDAWCAWVYWRAPAFVYMQPSGNAPYNAATAWQRAEDAEFTEQLLRGLTGKMLDPAWFNVDKLAGEAHVGLASLPTVEFSEIREEFQASEVKQSTVHSDSLPVKQDSTNEPPLEIDHPTASPPSLVLVAAQWEADQARERIRHFEAKIAAIETKITAFQQSLTQAIVQGTSTFRPRDIDKAIDRLHNDKKELEFRRDDWQLNLTTALSRLATVTQQEVPPKSVISGIHGLAVVQKIHEAQISRDVTATNPNPSSSSVIPSRENTIDKSQIESSCADKAKLPAKTADLSKYIDGAGLTDRQRECFSLKFEYGLRVSAIVKRLGLSRKTVDEHIAAAKRRIGWSQINEKRKANSARVTPNE
jgi:DNA-binding CsgD family transcriptional regulator